MGNLRRYKKLNRILAGAMALQVTLTSTPAFALRPQQDTAAAGLEQALDQPLVPTNPAAVLDNRSVGQRKALAFLKKSKVPVAMVVGDMDWLGLLNKIYSKQLVNPVLTRAFLVLHREVKSRGGIIYRNGGDEFVFLLPVKTTESDSQGEAYARRQIDQIRQAVAEELRRYYVIQNFNLDAVPPHALRGKIAATHRYGSRQLVLLEASNLDPADLEDWTAFEFQGNGGQMGLTGTGRPDPLTVSLGARLVERPSEISRKADYAKIRYEAEDALRQAKETPATKNHSALATESQPAVPHVHNKSQILQEGVEPTLAGKELELRHFPSGAVRKRLKSRNPEKNSREGVLVQIGPRYQGLSGFENQDYRDRLGYLRFKAINAIGLSAGDQMLKLLLAKAALDAGGEPDIFTEQSGLRSRWIRRSIGKLLQEHFGARGIRAPPLSEIYATLSRVLSDEAADGLQVFVALNDRWIEKMETDQDVYRKKIEEALSDFPKVFAEEIQRMTNQYLEQHLLPEFGDLRVTLDWAAVPVSGRSQTPLEGVIFNHLEVARALSEEGRPPIDIANPAEPMPAQGVFYDPSDSEQRERAVATQHRMQDVRVEEGLVEAQRLSVKFTADRVRQMLAQISRSDPTIVANTMFVVGLREVEDAYIRIALENLPPEFAQRVIVMVPRGSEPNINTTNGLHIARSPLAFWEIVTQTNLPATRVVISDQDEPTLNELRGHPNFQSPSSFAPAELAELKWQNFLTTLLQGWGVPAAQLTPEFFSDLEQALNTVATQA